MKRNCNNNYFSKFITFNHEKKPNFLHLTIKYLFFLIAFALFQNYLEDVFKINANVKSKLLDDYINNPIELFFIVVIFAPLIEEIIFRLPLNKTNYFLVSIIFSFIFFKGFDEKNKLISFIIIGYITSIICFQLFNKFLVFKRIIIFCSIITFTIVHINNYSFSELKLMSILELTLLFLPQLSLGLLTTNLRLQTKLYYPIILHSAYNAIIISIHLLT